MRRGDDWIFLSCWNWGREGGWECGSQQGGDTPPPLLGFVGQKTPSESKMGKGMGKGIEAAVRIRIASWGNLTSLFVIFGLYCSDNFSSYPFSLFFFRTK